MRPTNDSLARAQREISFHVTLLRFFFFLLLAAITFSFALINSLIGCLGRKSPKFICYEKALFVLSIFVLT